MKFLKLAITRQLHDRQGVDCFFETADIHDH